MAYAGRIGHPDGVKVFFTRDRELKAGPVVKIKYYAWNDRVFSSEGYGTRDLNINLLLSPTDDPNKEMDIIDFGTIRNSENGTCQLKVGDHLPCGIVDSVKEEKNGDDHRYNWVGIKLNDSIRERLSHTVTLVQYSTHVNYDKDYNNIVGMLIEKIPGPSLAAEED